MSYMAGEESRFVLPALKQSSAVMLEFHRYAWILAGQGHVQALSHQGQPHIGGVPAADKVAARVGWLIPHHGETVIGQGDGLRPAARRSAAIAGAGMHLHHKLISVRSDVKGDRRSVRY
jgi:hypothetical protein